MKRTPPTSTVSIAPTAKSASDWLPSDMKALVLMLRLRADHVAGFNWMWTDGEPIVLQFTMRDGATKRYRLVEIVQ